MKEKFVKYIEEERKGRWLIEKYAPVGKMYEVSNFVFLFVGTVLVTLGVLWRDSAIMVFAGMALIGCFVNNMLGRSDRAIINMAKELKDD